MKPTLRAAIFTLFLNGVSRREISRKIGVDRKTVRKYANEYEVGRAALNSPVAAGAIGTAAEGAVVVAGLGRSACESHREWIKEQVELRRNAVAIYQDLKDEFAFEHQYNSVKRFVRRLKHKDPEQFDRLEFAPGEEFQVDLGEGAPTRRANGKYRKPWLFVLALRYSRRAFRKTAWKMDQETWAKLHEEAFRYFGGCTTYAVLDNLKQGVIKPDLYDPRFNPVYAAMLQHYGVVADPCRVNDPNRKGTVENGIQHTQNTALKGRRFESVEEQNAFLMRWEERWAAPRIHGRTREQVEAMFQRERPLLKPLPLQSMRYFTQGLRTVQDDGTVQVGYSWYAARPAPIDSKVIVRIYDQEIEILDCHTLTTIRRHPRSTRQGSLTMLPEDRIFNPSRQTAYILQQAEKIGPSTLALCRELFRDQGRVGQKRMRGVVALSRKHSTQLIEHCCAASLRSGAPSYQDVRENVERLEREALTTATTHPLFTQEDDLIRSPEEYGEFWQANTATPESEADGQRLTLDLNNNSQGDSPCP